MTSFKVLRDTDDSRGKRIKYEGENTYAGFNIQHLNGDMSKTQTLAVLDCVGTYEIHDGETTAYVDLDELRQAIEAVKGIEWVDVVDAKFGDLE